MQRPNRSRKKAEPPAPNGESHAVRERKHWLDYATAIAVAGFAFWQAYIAKDTATRQLRAYMHFKEMEIALVRDAGGQDAFVFEPVFKNFGNTPAHIRRIIVSTRVVTDGNVDALTWPDTLEGAPEQSICMAPSLDGKVAELEVPLKDAKKLGDDYRLVYRFYVEYLTVFPELGPRKTAQVIEIRARGDPAQAIGTPGVRPSQIFRFPAHFQRQFC